MGLYRIYVLDALGHIAAPANIVECDSDQEATHHAQRYLDGKPIEVWLNAKRIARIAPDERSSPAGDPI